MLVNPDIQLISEIHELGRYFCISYFTKFLPQNIWVGQLVEKILKYANFILEVGIIIGLNTSKLLMFSVIPL